MIMIWIQDFSNSYPLQLISSLQAVFKLTFKSQISFSFLLSIFLLWFFFFTYSQMVEITKRKNRLGKLIMKFNWKLMLHKIPRTIRNRSFSSETISKRLKQTEYRCCVTSKLSEDLPLGSNFSLIFNLELLGNWVARKLRIWLRGFY